MIFFFLISHHYKSQGILKVLWSFKKVAKYIKWMTPMGNTINGQHFFEKLVYAGYYYSIKILDYRIGPFHQIWMRSTYRMLGYRFFQTYWICPLRVDNPYTCENSVLRVKKNVPSKNSPEVHKCISDSKQHGIKSFV